MKIILSRKGFDSKNGGIPSPIFEDGTMLSFPIPCDTDKTMYDDLEYKGKSYKNILNDLHFKKGIKYCHCDPDLDTEKYKKTPVGWEPAFGQWNSATSYLLNTVQVQIGDIFLFFGNFHHVEQRDGKYSYIHDTGYFYKDNDLQVIWGYLQVGKIIIAPEDQKKLYWHPHSYPPRLSDSTNVIFKSTPFLSFDNKRKGAGLLSYDVKRVLTLEGASKATWKKNVVYDTNHIIGHRKNCAKDPNMGIYYPGIWQELGLIEFQQSLDWAKYIII